MLRDGPHGLEVFLLKRHGLSDVLGDAYVFPGGKMDDHDVELVNRLDQPPAALHGALGEAELGETQAAALYVAAIREVFEEAGVLFAGVDGARARAAWASIRQGRRFDEVVSLLDVPLAATGLAPWSRWITPVASVRMRKRFDARFFVAAVPPGQEPVHDDHEATESVWLRPETALRQYWERQIDLAPPQIMTLVHMSRHADVAGVLAEARSRKPAVILPEVFEEAGMRMLCFPGDERHSVRSPVVPGPTRLCWRNDRHEPVGGLDTLFG
jgi:8-oxo-dGTP pyrophosphatase MutT (NUDIX family)